MYVLHKLRNWQDEINSTIPNLNEHILYKNSVLKESSLHTDILFAINRQTYFTHSNIFHPNIFRVKYTFKYQKPSTSNYKGHQGPSIKMFTISAICRLSIEPLFRYIIINIRVHPFKKLNRYLLNTFNSKGYPHQITRDPNKNTISIFHQ